MEDRRRMILAFALLIMVAFLPSLFSGNRQAPPNLPPTAVAPPDVGAADNTTVTRPPDVGPTLPPPTAAISSDPAAAADPNEEVAHARSSLYEYTFSSRGAHLASAKLNRYQSLRPNEVGNAQIIPEESEFLTYRLVFGSDTVSLADWQFESSAEVIDVEAGESELTWEATRGAATVRITYSFRPDDYVFDVRGEISGIDAGAALLLVGMGPSLRSVEVDSLDDQRSYGVVTKARKTDLTKFKSLDPGERADLEGPFEWVAIKSKYFLAAILAVEEGQARFGGGQAVGGLKTGRNDTRVHVAASLPVPANDFEFSMYVGPQEYRRLAAIGHDMQDVNPYGGPFRPIIGPVSVVIVKALLFLHENLGWGYGWLLILFGVGIRVLLWPLNQKAMRSQMAMQALQPEIEALKQKHQGDQQKVGQETMKLYKERGVNPMGGCLPMLLPMPILFAFFFVFLNTIELRGVSFLWLPDLSRPDPLYLIPLLMGASMYGVSKLGQRGIPPNPQSKMMLYIMPVMFTVLFLRFASGLNLYYASQNIASIPQQWIIAKERLKRLKT